MESCMGKEERNDLISDGVHCYRHLLYALVMIKVLETRIVPIKGHTVNMLIILNYTVLVTKYDSNKWESKG